MKLFFLPLLASLLLSFSVGSDDEKFEWQPPERLTWADFKGVPVPNGDFVASTNSGISFSYSISFRNGTPSFSYTVTSYFYPQLSWYVPEKVNDHILKHEQLHFDISELHARKLRKRLSKLSDEMVTKEKIKKIYNAVEGERRSMQAAFDFESDHSINKKEEQKWQQNIKKLLQQYEPWR